MSDLHNLSLALGDQLRTGRELIRATSQAPAEGGLGTAVPAFDRLLAGGLRRGTMVELIGGRSSGRFSLVLAALAAATAAGEAAALVDLGDNLAPQAAADAGADLRRLLWVRPRTLKQALASGEVILKSGIPLLVMELGMPPLRGGRGAEASWLRLARGARAERVALLVASPYRVSGTAAHAVVEAAQQHAVWRGRPPAPRLLRGLAARLALRKGRHRQPQASESIAFRLADDIADTVEAFPARRPAVSRPALGRRAIA